MLTGEPTDDHARPARVRPARKRRKRGTEAKVTKRVEILKAAASAFRRLGYHGATVEEIAKALGMKKGNLYYYFRSKEDILFACHQYSLDQLIAILDAVQQSDLSPDVKLRCLIVAFVQTILDELHGTALLLALDALSPAHLRAVVARRDHFDRGIRDVLSEGVRAGVFADGDTKLRSFAILGAVNWIPRWYSPDGPSSSETIAERFAEYLIAGLRPV